MSGEINIEEKEIRDYLKDNLELLGDGLVLVKEEYYIPNSQYTTRGYIDILAKDSQDNLVIIELKRSKQASRQAIHEVYKYITGLKRVKNVNSKQIRAIIVSTEWDELLYPYSQFIQDTDYMIEGYQLNIPDNLKSASTEKIKPIAIEEDFEFSRHQDVLFFRTEQDRNLALQRLKNYKENFKIKDLIILSIDKLKKDVPFNYCLYICYEKYNIYNLKDILKEHSIEEYNDFIELFFENSYDNEFLEIPKDLSDYVGANLEPDQEQFKRFVIAFEEENLHDFIDIPIDIHSLQEQMVEELTILYRNYIEYDDFEVGSPKYLMMMVASKEWSINKISRFGKFAENDFISDAFLLSEIYSMNDEMYYGHSLSSNKNKINEMKMKISEKFLIHNNWMEKINLIFDRLSSYNEYEISVLIYNPENILGTIMEEALPYFEIIINYEVGSEIFLGILESENDFEVSADDIMKNIFDGDINTFALYQSMRVIEEEENILNEMKLLKGVYLIKDYGNDSNILKVNLSNNQLKYEKVNNLPTSLFGEKGFQQFTKELKRLFSSFLIQVEDIL